MFAGNNEYAIYVYYILLLSGRRKDASFFRSALDFFPFRVSITAFRSIRENQQQRSDVMEKYVCNVCGYVYDPEKGDPDHGIKPGTKFEDLPDDWVCPDCGVGKGDFAKM